MLETLALALTISSATPMEPSRYHVADAGAFNEEIFIPPEVYAGQRGPGDILIGPVDQVAPQPNINVQVNVDVYPMMPVYEDPNLYMGPPRYEGGFDPRSRPVPAHSSRPMNPQTFQWHVRGAGESIEWYLTNVAGLVYPEKHEGIVTDLNGDGYTDMIYLVEVNPGGYYDNRYQFVSVWLNYGHEYEVRNEYVQGLFVGLQVDRGQVFLVEDRMGRLSYLPYRHK